MTTWEYKTLTGRHTAEEDVLNACGKLGWELVAVIVVPPDRRYYQLGAGPQWTDQVRQPDVLIQYVLKRPSDGEGDHGE